MRRPPSTGLCSPSGATRPAESFERLLRGRSRRLGHPIGEARGLVCAGGDATRLEELTRVTNKHLLPVGKWPMVYYPLELMQRCGIREVLVVTGQQHAGDFIDLLGDGKLTERSGGEELFDLDLTYRVQTRAGGIAEVVGMAEAFAGSRKLVVCLGDNVFECAETEAVRGFVEGGDGAQIFVKAVPDPERFGVVAYGDNGDVVDIVEKAGISRQPVRAAPVSRRGRRSLLLLAGCLRHHSRAGTFVTR